jgi:hypothetical protein
MPKFITAIQPNKDKIHYVELINDQPDSITECGVHGPFEEVVIQYRDRYEGRVCKKCFKSYVSSLTEIKIENDKDEEN